MKLTQIYERMEENKKNMEFLPTGLPMLDRELDGGFMRKELIVLGGNTGIGKSYLAAQIFHSIAIQGFKSAYFSLEISNELLVSRLLGQHANIKSTHVMTGRGNMFEQSEVNSRKTKLSAYEELLHFYDDMYVFDEIKKEIIKEKYEFIVIDFIQNVMVMKMDEYTRLSYVALELQKLAKQTNSTILVLSQLSNAVARDKTSTTPEYKGSGSIATVADLGFYIERGAADVETERNKIKLMLKKNRRGPSGLLFNMAFTVPGGLLYEQTALQAI